MWHIEPSWQDGALHVIHRQSSDGIRGIATAVFAYDSLGEGRKLTLCIDNADLVPSNWDWDNDKPHRGYWQTVDACRAKFPNGKY